MAFLQKVLEPPRYGFGDELPTFVRPTSAQIWSEFFYRLNIFRDRRNWLSFLTWTMTCALAIPFFIFAFKYASLKLVAAAFIYSMVCLGTHGTVYLHRYGTHRAFRFRNKFWIFICRNLVIKIIPEETYIVSHHVHHSYSEKPGDPYNVNGGWLYCFLADVNHQKVSQSLSPEDYKRVAGLIAHTGVKPNSYEQYKRWGSIASPWRTAFHFVVSWAVWYGIFYYLGGHALATALFGGAAFWAFGVRTYNYDGHGRGVDRRQDGIDFNRDDLSVNQIWPGYVAGEWHNNHHLFPNSARSGFLRYQLDLAWVAISTWSRLGIVSSYKDDKQIFMDRFVNGKTASLAKTNLSVTGSKASLALETAAALDS